VSVAVFIRPGCTGMGSCARIAPEVFRLDPATGRAEVVVQDAAPHQEAVTRAARSCPFIGVAIDGVPLEEPVAEATVVGVTQLAPSVVELRVRSKGFGFKPGQYAFVRLNDDRGEFFRSYSVVEAVGGVVVFSVRIVPQGRGGAVLTKLTPGERIGLSRAAGAFALLTTDQPKLFVTGGTGLAPVLPMLLAAPEAKKTVIFGGRTASDFFYLDRLQRAPNTEVILVASDSPPEWQGKRGLVTHALEELDLAGFAEVYTSGSPAMVNAVRDRLVARSFPPERIFSDAFEPGGPGPAWCAWCIFTHRSHWRWCSCSSP
jgi:CDP-4-dehydro-6-deoxyglucose reductase, E3